jgi:hypothetical protein
MSPDSHAPTHTQVAAENYDWVQLRTPLRYRSVAAGLNFITRKGAGDPLFPFATRRERMDVVMPDAFPPFLDGIARATYFQLADRGVASFEKTVQASSALLMSGRPREEVLRQFSARLDYLFTPVFESISDQERATVRSLTSSAFRQIVMHECAHHYLGHFDRMRAREIAVKDAEFEADLFAILNGIEAGEPQSAMYYFFSALASIDASTNGLGSANYDSFSDRANNVNAITGCLGIECLLILDASYGGGFILEQSSAGTLQDASIALLAGPKRNYDDGEHGRVAGTMLNEMHSELRDLLARLAADTPLLFSDGEYDSGSAVRLIADLANAARSFRHLNQIAAKCISLFLRRWGLRGRPLAPLVEEIEMLIGNELVAGRFHCGDLGRIHQAIGFSILHERVDLAASERLERGRAQLLAATDLNPMQAEAWAHLAFISCKAGNCEEAATYARRSMETYMGSEPESIQSFAEMMRNLASDKELCREFSVDYHPYPGL